MKHIVELKNNETDDFVGFAVFYDEKEDVISPVYSDFSDAEYFFNDLKEQ